jgi:hypothetical protein
MSPLVPQPDGSFVDPEAGVSYLHKPIGVGLSGPPPSSNGTAPLARRLADARVDLLDHLDGNTLEREWLPHSDRMLARGARHHVAAPLKSGKSLGFLAHAVDMVIANARVVILDRENGADEYARRLRDILADRPEAARDAIRERLAYYAWPAIKLADGQQLAAVLDGTDIVILDSTRTFLSALSLDENASDDFATFATAIVEPLFRVGIATVQLDNTGHDNTSRARGSSSKGDLADVLYSLKTAAPFDEQRRGRLRLVRAHSRFGDVAPSFTMELGAGHFGTFTTEESDGAAGFRPTALMSRVAAVIDETPGLSRNAIRQSVKGKNDVIDLAIERLAAEGNVQIKREGQTNRHYLERPFDASESHRAPPSPNRAPGSVHDTGPTEPLPVGGARGTGMGPAQPNDDKDAGPGQQAVVDTDEVVWDFGA